MAKSGYHYEIGPDGRRVRVAGVKRVKATPAVKAMVARKAALQGQGGYYQSKFVRKMNQWVPKGTLAAAGTAIGAKYGNPGLGATLGGGLAKILGFGSYKVKSNSMISEGNSPAAMHSTNSSVVVRHREYITDLVSGPANSFTSTTYAINPGLVNSFPWVSSIAAQYEQYKVKGMVYEFKTLYADAIASSAANSSIGGVIMSTNYNSVKPPFANKQQMDNAEYTTSCKPSECMYHPIECDPASYPVKQFYVRTGSAPANADLRMYDMGNFQVATFGIASANVVVGELWCTYEIEFSKPISTFSSGSLVLSDHLQMNGTFAAPTPIGSSGALVNNSSIGGIFTPNPGSYTFPQTITNGKFLVVVSIYGTLGGTMGPITVTPVNCTLLQYLANDNQVALSAPPPGTASSQVATLYFIVQVNNNSLSNLNTLTFGFSGTVGGTGRGDLWVVQLDNDIVS